VIAAGNDVHVLRTAETDVPELGSGRSAPIAQRCAPVRRQQAGRLDSAASNAAGAISQKPMVANSVIAEARRTVSYYTGVPRMARAFAAFAPPIALPGARRG
jgi:hypothetical protein